MRSTNTPYLRGVFSKILAAFVLVCVAIMLALFITRFSFREIMHTVDELTSPNEKLLLLNDVFEEITTLDQAQRAEAIKNPHKPYNTFLDQAATLHTMIDSLKLLSWDKAQVDRLDQMKGILEERNKLFFSYLKVKADLSDNRDFSVQLDTLAAILQNNELAIDSTLLTTHTKTTTTYLKDTASLRKSEQRSLLRKLFSKKKKMPVDTPTIRIDHVQRVEIDTIAAARQNQALIEVEKIMRALEKDQNLQRRNLQQQELELINANGLFINQLVSILHEVEREELQQMQANNKHAVTVMNQSISRTNILMLCFFLAAAVLVYLILVDISKSNFYKEQLEKARDEAEQLSLVKQRFLANMSHELRTPLQSIIGFAEQLKQKNDGKQEEANAIYSSSEHLLHVVNEVLDYSRISSGNFVLAHENFRLLTLIREVEAAMRIQADYKKLTFILDCEQVTDHTLVGDPFRLRQILYNVIGNAIKFTQKGFVRLSVHTISENNTVRCIFEVADSGIGMDKEEQSKIFNQFEQANASITKHYGGTGLGLTIVKSLVEAQHGDLYVTSEPGMGSVFRIDLVFEKAVADNTVPALQNKTMLSGAFKGKVVLIDDDSLILKLCALILKKHRIPHVTFTSANRLMDSEPDPQVTHIFLDIRMPEINGVDLCKALRKKYNPAVRFTALTAHVLPEEKESLINEGFDSILSKPFHELELLQSLGITSPDDYREAIEQPDFTTLKKMTMGDEVLFQSIIVQFIDETMEDLSRINHDIKEQNKMALRETVHKMAGRFAQLGMTALAARLNAIERKLVAGYDTTDLADEVTRLSKKASDTVIQIRLTTLEQLN
jgi:signal transduction histidine kinase/DNA-binding NarL/FixJ family response regulator